MVKEVGSDQSDQNIISEQTSLRRAKRRYLFAAPFQIRDMPPKNAGTYRKDSLTQPYA
jgi:hypothetical protein